MKLYDLELSGNCYKVRLLAALASIELARIFHEHCPIPVFSEGQPTGS